MDGLEQGGGDQAGGQDFGGGSWGRHSEPRRGEEGFLGVRVGAVGEDDLTRLTEIAVG